MKPVRIEELDYLKGILITLVVLFHLTYFSTEYTLAKQFVYTFHMPAFLVISGWLMNIEAPLPHFGRMISKILLPYIVFESGYIVISAFKMVAAPIPELNVSTFLYHFFTSPVGPYWFLHTLIICAVVYKVWHTIFASSTSKQALAMVLTIWLLAHYVHIISFASGCFFIAGAILRRSNIHITNILSPNILALIALVVLCSNPAFFVEESLSGIAIVYVMMSVMLLAYNLSPHFLRTKVCYLGQRTLPIYLYSPLFTFLFKAFKLYFSFDPTRFVFAFVATTCCIVGSLCADKVVKTIINGAQKVVKR
jgi:acyltransferase